MDALKRTFYDQSLESLNELYKGAAWIGLWIALPPQPSRVKAIPALRLNDPEAMEMCRLVVNSSEKEKEVVNKIYSELGRIDETRALSHIVNAFAFATKGHWYAALTLCQLAIGVAERGPKQDRTYERRREAAYLAAVAQRRLAQDEEDLQKAQDYLTNARRADAQSIDDVRFLAEQWAIKRMSLSMAYYSRASGTSVGSAEIAVQIERCVQGLREVLVNAETEKMPAIRNWVERQAFANIFNCVFIASEEQIELKEIGANARRDYLRRFAACT